ncbi:synaptotagmin-12 [Trichonephila clavipes]|nr:synaptotagmin-12 [Trichonephila clavipes]
MEFYQDCMEDVVKSQCCSATKHPVCSEQNVVGHCHGAIGRNFGAMDVPFNVLYHCYHSGSTSRLRKTEELIVMILRGRNLMAFDTAAAKVDSYIRVSVVPDETSIMQTALHRDNANPEYNERFVFSAPKNTVRDRTLKCIAYTCDKSSNTLLGQVELKLANVDFRDVYTAWFPLIDTKRLRPLYKGSTRSFEKFTLLSELPPIEIITRCMQMK